MNKGIHDVGESPVERFRCYQRQVQRRDLLVNAFFVVGVVLWAILVFVVAEHYGKN
jgi:hypothetical protein